jgi:hypothetical protein
MADHPEVVVHSDDRRLRSACWSVCDFVVESSVLLSGEVKNPRRRDDLRLGWLQNRVPAGWRPGKEGFAEPAPNRVLTRHHQPGAYAHLSAELLTLHGQVADPGRCLGEAAVRDWVRLPAIGVAGGNWFGGTEGRFFLLGVAAAQFGVGGDGQVPGAGGGVFPFLPVGHGLGQSLLLLLIEVAQGRSWTGLLPPIAG